MQALKPLLKSKIIRYLISAGLATWVDVVVYFVSFNYLYKKVYCVFKTLLPKAKHFWFLTFVFFFIKMDIEKVPLFIILLLILPLVLIISYLFIAKTVKQMHIVSNLIKIYMVLGIASMLYFSQGLSPILINYVAFLKQLF